MVINVDFDLTMSIMAHKLLNLLAKDLPGYSHNNRCHISRRGPPRRMCHMSSGGSEHFDNQSRLSSGAHNCSFDLGYLKDAADAIAACLLN